MVSFLRKIFARRENACDRCGSLQRDLCDWDGTRGGKVVAEKLRLCADCAQTALRDSFHQIRLPCVAVEPVLNKGGYYGLTVDAIPEFWGLEYRSRGAPGIPKAEIEAKTNEIVGTLHRIAESAGAHCVSCHARPASCYWVGGDAFGSKWERFFALVEDSENIAGTSLCADCAGNEMANSLKARSLRIDAIWPPKPDTVVMLSANY